MNLDNLIERLQTIRAQHGGALPVVSGLARSGYGEAVTDVSINEARPYVEGEEGVDGNGFGPTPELVVELFLADNSSHIS